MRRIPTFRTDSQKPRALSRVSWSRKMIRVTGHYQKQSVELDAPLSLSDGTIVEVVVRVNADPSTVERDEFEDLGLTRLEEE